MEGHCHGQECSEWQNFPRETVSVIKCSWTITDSKIQFFNRYSEELELDDAVHTAILTLKEGFEGKMTADNIEVGICNEEGFQRLDPAQIKDYLANIP